MPRPEQVCLKEKKWPHTLRRDVKGEWQSLLATDGGKELWGATHTRTDSEVRMKCDWRVEMQRTLECRDVQDRIRALVVFMGMCRDVRIRTTFGGQLMCH